MMHVKSIYGTTPNKLSEVMYSNHSTLESDQRRLEMYKFSSSQRQ